MSVIDGKALATQIREDLKQKVVDCEKKIGRKPCLAIILVGDDYGSGIYVRNKEKACGEVGIKSIIIKMDKEVSQEEVLAMVDKLNKDDTVDGFMVQLPLPKHIDEATVVEAISYKKDADGLHTMSCGQLLQGKDGFLPCTPHGCIKLIESTGMDIAGKNAVVIGRSNIVGKPVAMLLLRKNATVTICHSKTQNLKEICLNADIIVCAIGRAHFLTGDMVKKGATVIDVGINRLDGKVTGDVDFDTVKDVAGFVTPVPGGVGPMTITMLMYNTVEGANKYGKK